MVRSRAEHNEGMLSNLEEVALHQQNIEKIEFLGHICPHLKILYLQNNLIGKIQNLHKLKVRPLRGTTWTEKDSSSEPTLHRDALHPQELEYLNLAVNNITKIQNLQRCESLQRLDLTVNFVDKAGLLTIDSLSHNVHLKELFLLGNPCTDWSGYRQYIIAKLPRLKKLVGLEDACKHACTRPHDFINMQALLA